MTDQLDDRRHESLTQAILARTSGGGCGAARDRLCDFADGALAAFDGDLVAGHLDHCPACAALAAALAEAAEVLPSFATLAPRVSLVSGVLSATSRRVAEPTFGERAKVWLAHIADRPRFSLEAAYVLTVLLLVVFGNPVNAFKEASVRVQPRVNAVASVVAGPVERLRTAGERRLASAGQSIAPKPNRAGAVDAGRAWLSQWWRDRVDQPVRSLLSRLGEWMASLEEAVKRAMGLSGSEPPPPPAR